MRIPQNWFLGGLDHHGVVWFRYEFRTRTHPGKFATLHFNGVDYFADVYLNGVLLGRHTGYFEPFSFDITRVLRSGKNMLAVRVDSPYETPGVDGWYLHKNLIKGIFNQHDCRPGGGWEPIGQSFNTGGIWNRVTLEEHGPVTIEQALLRANPDVRKSVLHAEVTLLNRTKKQRSKLEIHCAPENSKGESYSASLAIDLPRGLSTHRIDLPVPETLRWNPWDRGEPNLYTVSLNIEDATRTSLFGFRTVRVEEGFKWFVNGEPYFPRGANYIASQWLSETLFPEISQEKDHPFGAKGVNDGPSWFERDLALARQANLNLLRVHAHVLPEEFYTICDRAGVLVWQDFPLQWGYTDDADFQDEAVHQLRAMLALLTNHPSIAAWCCHNEGPSDAPWMAGQAGAIYDPQHNRALDDRLEATARKLNSHRYVHKNSGTGDGHAYPGWYFGHIRDFENLPGAPFVTEYGAQGLPVKESLLRTFSDFGPDAGHSELLKLKSWIESYKQIKGSTRLLMKSGTAVWNFTEKVPALKPVHSIIEKWAMKNMMATERSIYQRLPSPEEIPQELQHAREVWESWRFHDFQPPETFENGIALGASLEEFIDNSQAYQAALIQVATEAYRRNKADKVTGIIQFDFTDPWPAITWSVLDYWRVPKPAFDALRRSMQPVLPSFRLPDMIEAGKALPSEFFVVNDLLAAFLHAKVEWRLENDNGYIASATFPVDVPSNGVSTCIRVTLPSLPAGKSQLLVLLTSPRGEVIGENRYEFRLGKRPELNVSLNPSASKA